MFRHKIIYLYQMCRLDIPGAVLATALFEELKNAIPCQALTLIWQTAKPAVARAFYESEAEVDCRFFETESFNQLFSGTDPGLFTELEAKHPLLLQIAEVLPGIAHGMSQHRHTLAVYLPHAGKRLGAILLHHLHTERFSRAEKATLVRWVPTLAAALTKDTAICQFVTSENQAGILLLDSSMTMSAACRRGRKLIRLAAAPNSKTQLTHRSDNLEKKLRAHASFENATGELSFIVCNGWGSFQFHIHRLNEVASNAEPLIAVTVQRREPLALHMFHSCRNLGLTEKQTDICLLLVKGLSYDAVAIQLGIRATTVIDHVRKIYQKIGVCNRSELVTVLLLGEKKTAPDDSKMRHSAAKLRPSVQYQSVSSQS